MCLLLSRQSITDVKFLEVGKVFGYQDGTLLSDFVFACFTHSILIFSFLSLRRFLLIAFTPVTLILFFPILSRYKLGRPSAMLLTPTSPILLLLKDSPVSCLRYLAIHLAPLSVILEPAESAQTYEVVGPPAV